MGGTWEVTQWVARNKGINGCRFGTETVYMGESLFRAIACAIKAKRAGAGCVSIHWRG